ncbi:MAG: BMC domain-containing protein [Candidatus Zixiibacteriota bacterium]
MADYALGLIETNGLIAAITAADAAAKTAAVVVSSAEVTDGALLTIRIEGELGAVQAAVEAAAQAAQLVGEVVTVHVIPRPDILIAPILPQLRYVSKYHPEETRLSLTAEESNAEEPNLPASSPSRLSKSYSPPMRPTLSQLEEMTVPELRNFARTVENLSIRGREISMAGKQQLLDAIKIALGME